MLALTPETAWLIILGIAAVSVLTCLRAIALILGRSIAIHNLRVETHARRSAAMARVRDIKQRRIISV